MQAEIVRMNITALRAAAEDTSATSTRPIILGRDFTPPANGSALETGLPIAGRRGPIRMYPKRQAIHASAADRRPPSHLRTETRGDRVAVTVVASRIAAPANLLRIQGGAPTRASRKITARRLRVMSRRLPAIRTPFGIRCGGRPKSASIRRMACPGRSGNRRRGQWPKTMTKAKMAIIAPSQSLSCIAWDLSGLSPSCTGLSHAAFSACAVL